MDNTHSLKRTHLVEKDTQVFFDRENWASVLTARLQNWQTATDIFGRNYATLILTQTQPYFRENIEKLVEGGLTINNQLLFALPYHIGLYDTESSLKVIEYFQYLQSLGLDIKSQDEHGNNLFVRFEKSFNENIFNYFLEQEVEPDSVVIASLINSLNRDSSVVEDISEENNVLDEVLHEGIVAEAKHNQQKVEFIKKCLDKASIHLNQDDYKIMFSAISVPHEKLMGFYSDAGAPHLFDALERYQNLLEKDESMFYPNQIKIIRHLENYSGQKFLKKQESMNQPKVTF